VLRSIRLAKTAQAAWHEAKSKISDLQSLETYVREKPTQAVLVALGVGLIVGLTSAEIEKIDKLLSLLGASSNAYSRPDSCTAQALKETMWGLFTIRAVHASVLLSEAPQFLFFLLSQRAPLAQHVSRRYWHRLW
jgi:hypothetical protein